MKSFPHLLRAVLLGLGTVSLVHAQLNRKVNLRSRNQEISTILQTICTFSNLNLLLGPELRGKKVSLDLKNIPAGDLMHYLSKLHGFGLAVTQDGKTILAGSKEAIANMNVSEARVVTLSHASAGKMAGILGKVYGGKVEAIADPRTNSVILVPTGKP